MIHTAIAKELNKKLNRDENKLLLGAVAPDISKCAGESRNISHFIDEEDSNLPNIERFLDKYKYDLDDDFVMGYFIHLYTDYLWFKYFMSEIIKDGTITNVNNSAFDSMLLTGISNSMTSSSTNVNGGTNTGCTVTISTDGVITLKPTTNATAPQRYIVIYYN